MVFGLGGGTNSSGKVGGGRRRGVAFTPGSRPLGTCFVTSLPNTRIRAQGCLGGTDDESVRRSGSRKPISTQGATPTAVPAGARDAHRLAVSVHESVGEANDVGELAMEALGPPASQLPTDPPVVEESKDTL